MALPKTALVTGASRGIGRAIALKLAAEGYHIIALARTIGALEELDDTISAAGGTCTLIPQDLLKIEMLENLGPALLEKCGHLDLLVLNAGLLGTLGPLTHTKPKEFQQVMDVNVVANFHLLRTLDPLLKKSESAQVVFVTTSAGVMAGRAYWGSYGITKAALNTMAAVYAAENEQTNIKVKMFDPGAVRTSMRAAAVPGEDPLTLPPPEDAAEKLWGLL